MPIAHANRIPCGLEVGILQDRYAINEAGSLVYFDFGTCSERTSKALHHAVRGNRQMDFSERPGSRH